MSPLIIIYFSLLSSVNFCFIILEFVIRDYNHKILIYSYWIIFIIIQFNCSVVFDSLQLHKSQHARSPSPSPTPRVHSNSCLSSRWCHPAISSSVIPFSSCLQSHQASGSFSMSQLFAWGGQSTGVSALASVPPMKTQDWSPLGWTGWISLQSKVKSINASACNFHHSPTLTSIHAYWENHSLD